MNDQNAERLYVPAMAGFYASVQDLAYPMVRFFAGLFLVPHGAQKLFNMFGGNIDGTAAFFAKAGLEPALALAYFIAIGIGIHLFHFLFSILFLFIDFSISIELIFHALILMFVQ